MSNIFTRFFKGLILRGETSDPSDNIEGSIFHNSSDSRLKTYIGGAVREVLTNSQGQNLTNKTINVSNNTVVTTAVGNLSSTELNAALNELQTDIDTRVVGPTSSVDNQVARFDGTTGKLIDSVSGSTLSDTGIMASSQFQADLALLTNRALVLQGSVADTSTGSNVVLASNSYARLRLTGVGLVSIGGIATPTSGRLFILSNETGGDITIVHDDSTVAAISNRFYTPDGTDFTFKNNSMIWYMYTDTINRHVIISGGTSTSSGGGGGGGGGISYASVSILALNIDWSLGTTYYKTISSNTTFTFSNLVEGKTITVMITADSVDRIVAFPNTKQAAGYLESTVYQNSTTIYTFTRTNGITYCSSFSGVI